MNKLITALNNSEINNKLKKTNKYKILYEDISYQEGIFEVLEKEEIDIILLSEILKGPYNIKELINKIKEINSNVEIIVILEKRNKELEKFLIEKNINNYFYNNQLSIKEFTEMKFISKKINNKIEDLKKYILKRKYAIDEINKKRINIKKFSEKYFKRKSNKKYIVSFFGKDSMKKSISILIFSLVSKNKKILNIDLDFLNQNVNTLFSVSKYPNINNVNIKEKILKLNNNIHILSGIEEISNNDYEEILIKINELKNIYDYIFINLSSITNLKLTKKILEKSDCNICIFNNENNDISYNNNLLKIYTEEWGIDKNKFINFFEINKNNKFINECMFFDLNLRKYMISYNIKMQYKRLLKCIK